MAESKTRAVREELNRQRMFMYPHTRRLPGQIPVWEASFVGPYAAGALHGEWRLHGRWRYWSDLESGDPTLQESSVGVTVVTHGQAELPESTCIARYDVERYGHYRGRHINAFQPVLQDNVHWCYLDGAARFEDWPFDELLQFLILELPAELVNAGWPVA